MILTSAMMMQTNIACIKGEAEKVKVPRKIYSFSKKLLLSPAKSCMI